MSKRIVTKIEQNVKKPKSKKELRICPQLGMAQNNVS